MIRQLPQKELAFLVDCRQSQHVIFASSALFSDIVEKAFFTRGLEVDD